MKKNSKKKLKKKNIIICLIIIILIFGISIIFKNFKKKNIIYNKNESFLKKQEVDGITFDKIECYYDGKESLISYIISNNSNKTIELKNYEVLVKDKKENVITNIFVGYSTKLSPKEKKNIKNKVIDKDLSDAYKLELKTNVDNKKEQ